LPGDLGHDAVAVVGVEVVVPEIGIGDGFVGFQVEEAFDFGTDEKIGGGGIEPGDIGGGGGVLGDGLAEDGLVGVERRRGKPGLDGGAISIGIRYESPPGVMKRPGSKTLARWEKK